MLSRTPMLSYLVDIFHDHDQFRYFSPSCEGPFINECQTPQTPKSITSFMNTPESNFEIGLSLYNCYLSKCILFFEMSFTTAFLPHFTCSSAP